MARWTTIKYFFRLLFVKNIQNDDRITGKKELMIRTTIKSLFGCYYFVKSIRNRKKGIYDMNNHKIYFLGCIQNNGKKGIGNMNNLKIFFEVVFG